MDNLFEKCYDRILNNRNLGEDKDYYYRNYWLQMRLGKITCENIIIEIFDYALEVGCTEAIKTAQKITFIEETGIMDRFTSFTINNFQKVFLYRYQHARKVYEEFKEEQKRLNSINLKH